MCGGLSLLLYNGGTVCDNNFGMDDAHVICRSMGYPGAVDWKSVNENNIPGWRIQEEYNIKLGHVYCPAGGSWNQCSFYTNPSFCNHNEDVFLFCAGKIQKRIKVFRREAQVSGIPQGGQKLK